MPDQVFSPAAIERAVQSLPPERPSVPDWFTANGFEANDRQPAPTGTGLASLAKAVFVGGEAADLATTRYGLAHGYREFDPLYSFAGQGNVLPVWTAVDAGLYLIAKRILGEKHPTLLNLGLLGSGLTHGAFAAHNLAEFASHPRPIQ